MKTIAYLNLIALLLLLGCQTSTTKKTADQETQTITYEETWESIAQHNEEPEWFQDAKLGIYFHWGVYAVPAYGSEWYPRNMHIPGHPVYEHHLEKYGHPSEFGYNNFVPMFKAEHFDAEEWAELFVKAGAKFAGPVAEHHDGFSMWASKATPWNTLDKGPGRDITGELNEAITGRGMKFITTFHHARHLQRYTGKEQEEMDSDTEMTRKFRLSHYPLFEGMPTKPDDTELKYLYGNIQESQWLEEVWYGKLKEVIDNYQPDIMWFDSWLDQIPEEYRLKYCAYYLNEARKWGKEVVIVRKQDDLPLDCSVDDLEKSRKNVIETKSWMTDETISKGSWSYTENLDIKATPDVLHVLIDIVSKNGVLLLNISPKADGTIPQNQKEVLLGIGEWLDKYGEAIYGTRPWYTFGEGPTKEPEGHFRNRMEFLNLKYSSKDIRYTTKENTIYATILGWPGNKETVLLESFSGDMLPDELQIKEVEMLGSDNKIEWAMTDRGLEFVTPAEQPDEMAVVFKIVI